MERHCSKALTIILLIPYHAWANRGVTEMMTWLLDEEKG